MAATEENRIGEELKKMEWEPLLPIEKKLIAWESHPRGGPPGRARSSKRASPPEVIRRSLITRGGPARPASFFSTLHAYVNAGRTHMASGSGLKRALKGTAKILYMEQDRTTRGGRSREDAASVSIRGWGEGPSGIRCEGSRRELCLPIQSW